EWRAPKRCACRAIYLSKTVREIVVFVKVGRAIETVGLAKSAKDLAIRHHRRGRVDRAEIIGAEHHFRACDPRAGRGEGAARSVNGGVSRPADVEDVSIG